MQTIALLSDELVDQIAAGEVVERPASVVKELGENALDAGARNLLVRLEGGGTQRIEVVDDGHGMSQEDASLALRRHATSKLSSLAGLQRIATFGFRGEALAAVASVSRLLLRTAEAGASAGTEVRVEAGLLVSTGAAPARTGTQVVVEDLFHGVPARRKFLRRQETELRHCEQAVLRLALAHPAVAFRLEHAGRVLLSLPPSGQDVAERIAAALGAEVHPHLLALEERRLDVRVHGVIASPEYSQSTARGLYTFVNGRYVRDRAVHAAIHRGLQPLLPPGRQPVGVLFLELPPGAVDVNVHPQKLEVRFSDTAGVTDAVHTAVGRAVRGADWLQAHASGAAATPDYAQAVERFLRLAQDAEGAALPFPPTLPAVEGGASRAPAFGESRPGRNEAPAPGFFGRLRVLGFLERQALVCEGPGGSLVVLDLHAAYERVCLEHLAHAEGPDEAQAEFLGPPLEVGAPAASRLAEVSGILATLGLGFEPFGAGAIRWRRVPAALAGLPGEALVRAVLEAPDARPETLRAALACATASLSVAESSERGVLRLLRQLDASDFSRPCHHRALVTLELPLLDVAPNASRR
ncbi:MAG: DNA mismatch repair endonuclease MutL [Myxococcaceae bacterium]